MVLGKPCKKKNARTCFVLFFNTPEYLYHFYFPAQLVGAFTLSNLLDKAWSQVSSLLAPDTCLYFYRA